MSDRVEDKGTGHSVRQAGDAVTALTSSGSRPDQSWRAGRR
jgi:hypothetical protein